MWNHAALKDMQSMFRVSIKAVQPDYLIRQNVRVHNNILHIKEKSFDLSKFHVSMVGFGKAVQLMAREMENVLGDKLKKGVMSIPKGSLLNEPISSRITFLEGAENNLPDEDAMRNAIAICDVVKSLTKEDLLIVLISGGGSALLPLPKEPLSLSTKLNIIKKLANSGADIKELNCVRKRLSCVKGGQLAKMAYPATIVSLILSDIVGDPLDLIASGPTVLNTERNEKAIQILKEYNIYNDLSSEIKRILYLEDDAEFHNDVSNVIIGSNKVSLDAAQNRGFEMDYKPLIVSNSVTGSVTDVAQLFHDIVVCIVKKDFQRLQTLFEKIGYQELVDNAIINDDKICLIFGGETTVKVKGTGLGGRNQHLALLFAKLLHDSEDLIDDNSDIALLCAGTDGIDGPTDAAGAVVYRNIVKDALVEGLDVHKYLLNCDSYNFFKKFDGGKWHVKCGHTNTNVMDVNILQIKLRK